MEQLEKAQGNKGLKKFFLSLGKASLGYSFILMGIVSVLSTLTMLEYLTRLLEIIPHYDEVFLEIGIISGIGKVLIGIVIFIWIFVSWLILSLVCFLLLRIFEKKPKFERVLSILSYKYIFNIILVSILWGLLRDVNIASLMEVINALDKDMYIDIVAGLSPIITYIIMAGLLYFLFEIVLSGLFVFFSFYYVFDLKFWQSIIIVIVIKLLGIVFFLY